MPKIKYIFRDFWGTVARLGIRNTYRRQLEKIYGISEDIIRKAYDPPMDKFRRWEINEEKFWKIFSKNIHLPIHKDSLKLFHIPVKTYANVYKSTISLVSKLQKLGCKSVILSDDIEPQCVKINEQWRYNYFDDVIISCDIWISKHDDKINNTTKIFRYALKKYKLQPEEAIFVDDIEANCDQAKKLWIKTVVAKSPRQTVRDIKKILKI